MSKVLKNQLNSFKNYKFDCIKNQIINLHNGQNANLDEFLEITHILDINFQKYKFTSNIDIILLAK